MKYTSIMIAILIYVTKVIQAVDLEDDNLLKYTHFVVIPGQDGYGKKADNPLQHIIDTTQFPSENIHYVNTPIATKNSFFTYADFGQYNCQYPLSLLMEQLDSNDSVKRIIVYAISQGTATATNYFKSHQHPKVKALIYEGVMASGNSAISHYGRNKINIRIGGIKIPVGKWFSWTPGSFYTMPYIVSSVVYPWYSIGGQQAIQSLHQMPNETPFILVHSKEDQILSHDDAVVFYTGLKDAGNPNVHLLTSNKATHVDLFKPDEDQDKEAQRKSYIQTIHHILRNKGLELPQLSHLKHTSIIDLTETQPEGDMNLLNHYLGRENAARVFNRTLIAHAIFGITYYLLGRERCS